MKRLLLSLLLIALFLFLGCTQNQPICGDNICSTEEIDPNSSYFCTNDCKVQITEIAEEENWKGKKYCKLNCNFNAFHIVIGDESYEDRITDADREDCKARLKDTIMNIVPNISGQMNCGSQTPPNCSGDRDFEFLPAPPASETCSYGSVLFLTFRSLVARGEGTITCNCGG